MELYERGLIGTSPDVFLEELFWLLVKHGYLRKVEVSATGLCTEPITVTPVNRVNMISDRSTYDNDTIRVGMTQVEEHRSTDKNPFLGNGMPIESNVESIAKVKLGVCEDRDKWKKELKLAVKEHGHDEILNSFHDWCDAQAGNFLGSKPVTTFLRNVGQNLTIKRPSVSSPLLDSTEKAIALLTNNTVFFSGSLRFKLASLLKEYGLTPVNQAFAEFWPTVDEKQVNWAARDFLQRAAVMINTIETRQKQAEQQKALVDTAYQQAKQNVEPADEDEEL